MSEVIGVGVGISFGVLIVSTKATIPARKIVAAGIERMRIGALNNVGSVTTNTMTKLAKGQIVKSGSSEGTVLRYRGPFAVEVWTYYERPEQDFITHKVTVAKGYRKETWPIKSVTVHDHSCHCGGLPNKHEIGQNGCFRYLTEAPALRPDDHWLIDGEEITDYTLKQQRGYFQHSCGCWSRHNGDA